MNRQKQIFLFLISYFAYTAIYIARLNLTIASPVLQAEGIMTVAQIGLMGGVFFLAYSVGQLFNGFLGDIFHPKYMIMSGLFLVTIANLRIGMLPSASAVIFWWCVNGFAQSMLWGPLLRTVSGRFSEERRSLVATIFSSSVGAGSILGIVLASLAVGRWHVKYAFLLPGILNAAAFFGILCFFHVPEQKSKGKRASIGAVFSQPKLWLLLLPAFFHGVLKDNLNLWMAVYFIDTFSIDIEKMSFYVFLIPVLSLGGRMVYPFLYGWCHEKEHLVSIAAFALSAVVLVPLCLSGTTAVMAAVCLSIVAAAVSVINTSFLTIYPMGYQQSGNVSTVAGVMDFATYLGAGISSALYGILLESMAYSGMFLSWILLSVLSVVILGKVYKRSDGLADGTKD